MLEAMGRKMAGTTLLTLIMNNMASCFEFLEGNLGSFGEYEDVPILIPHYAWP
jgi:hypothetical protein